MMVAPAGDRGFEDPQVRRVISGVQPSGVVHLGNYFGAIKEHIEWAPIEDRDKAPRAKCFVLIADYHALTTEPDPVLIRERSLEIAMTYLACGLDAERAMLYRASNIPEVCELAWLLSTVAPESLLVRAHAVKDARQNERAITAALFNYPVLMAADILIMRADTVPVGYDQLQHLEMARDLARKFNSTYFPREGLVVPSDSLSRAPIVLGTDREKMSKRYGNTIGIFEVGAELTDRVMSIKTDSRRENEPKDPDGDAVFNMYTLVASADEVREMRERYEEGRIGYREAKQCLIEAIVNYFALYRDRYLELERDADTVRDVLADGARRAREEAGITMEIVRTACGLASGQKS